MHIKCALFVISSFSYLAAEKVLILTHSFSRPDFIVLQDKTFKAFLKDDYEFVVMNDAPNEQLSKAIETTCKELNIRSVRIPQHIHTGRTEPSQGIADAMQYSMSTLGFTYDGIVAIVDSDIFLVAPLSIVDYITNFDLVAHKQQRPLKGPAVVTYIWQGLIFFDMRTLPNKQTMNFDCGMVEGFAVDTCGQTHHYLKNNPMIKIKFYAEPKPDGAGDKLVELPNDRTALAALGYGDDVIDFIVRYHTMNDPYSMEFHLDSKFIHYRGGGNWIKKPEVYHAGKGAILTDFIQDRLGEFNVRSVYLHGGI